MNEEKCRELARIPALIALDKPLQKDFLEHSATCEQCLFWTSFTLAILETVRTTDRLIRDEDCPSNDSLSLLLLANAHAATSKTQSGPNRNIFSVTTENFGLLYDAKEHINRDNPDHCPICAAHYDDLFKKALKLQKEYKNRILAGEEIRPVIKNSS